MSNLSPRALALRDLCPGIALRPEDWEVVAQAVEGVIPAWQSIETAEKEDGTSLLLSDGRDVFEGYWEAARDFWACADGGAAYPVPTLWQPLPTPPTAAEKTGETGA